MEIPLAATVERGWLHAEPLTLRLGVGRLEVEDVLNLVHYVETILIDWLLSVLGHVFALLEISIVTEQKTNKRQHINVEHHIITKIIVKPMQMAIEVDVPNKPAQIAQPKDEKNNL